MLRITSASPSGRMSIQIQREDRQTAGSSGYVGCEARVPDDHPLRLIRAIADEAFEVLSPQFQRRYANAGRSSIARQNLLRSLLPQALGAIDSRRNCSL